MLLPPIVHSLPVSCALFTFTHTSTLQFFFFQFQFVCSLLYIKYQFAIGNLILFIFISFI